MPGSAAPIKLTFMDVTGSKTGKFLPTGRFKDLIDGLEVTCMDVTMPVVIGRAIDFGITGYEDRDALDLNKPLFKKIEAVRLKAAALMGLGDASKSVAPKFALLAPAKKNGTIAVRYFYAVADASNFGSDLFAMPSCVCFDTWHGGRWIVYIRPEGSPATIDLEHQLGTMRVVLDYVYRGL